MGHVNLFVVYYMNGKEMKELNMYPTLMLEKFPEAYLHSTRNDSNSGSIKNVYILAVSNNTLRLCQVYLLIESRDYLAHTIIIY